MTFCHYAWSLILQSRLFVCFKTTHDCPITGHQENSHMLRQHYILVINWRTRVHGLSRMWWLQTGEIAHLSPILQFARFRSYILDITTPTITTMSQRLAQVGCKTNPDRTDVYKVRERGWRESMWIWMNSLEETHSKFTASTHKSWIQQTDLETCRGIWSYPNLFSRLTR